MGWPCRRWFDPCAFERNCTRASPFGKTEPSRMGKISGFRHQSEYTLGACASLRSRILAVGQFMRTPTLFKGSSVAKAINLLRASSKMPETFDAPFSGHLRRFQGIFEHSRASSKPAPLIAGESNRDATGMEPRARPDLRRWDRAVGQTAKRSTIQHQGWRGRRGWSPWRRRPYA
jgi:hypothetical protein